MINDGKEYFQNSLKEMLYNYLMTLNSSNLKY